MVEIMRVKEAQFQEFRRRFYGQSREQAYRQMQELLQYSMNIVDRESVYRGTIEPDEITLDGSPIRSDTASAISMELDRSGRSVTPGAGAGTLPDADDAPLVPDADTPGTDDPGTDGGN